jgi:hypothetical protein
VRPLALTRRWSAPSVLVVLLAALVVVAGCPSQECRDYVACQRAYDDDVEVTRYDEGGV